MRKTMAILLAVLAMLGVLAGCGSSSDTTEAPAAAAPAAPAAEAPAAADVTWDDYINWMADTFGANSPDPDDYRATLSQAKSWADIDVSSPPWDRLFAEDGFNASTWDEFVANGGVGTYNEDFEDSAFTGSGEPTGEPSGEPTDEPAN